MYKIAPELYENSFICHTFTLGRSAEKLENTAYTKKQHKQVLTDFIRVINDMRNHCSTCEILQK